MTSGVSGHRSEAQGRAKGRSAVPTRRDEERSDDGTVAAPLMPFLFPLRSWRGSDRSGIEIVEISRQNRRYSFRFSMAAIAVSVRVSWRNGACSAAERRRIGFSPVSSKMPPRRNGVRNEEKHTASRGIHVVEPPGPAVVTAPEGPC